MVDLLELFAWFASHTKKNLRQISRTWCITGAYECDIKVKVDNHDQ